jgi:hypothetical protein
MAAVLLGGAYRQEAERLAGLDEACDLRPRQVAEQDGPVSPLRADRGTLSDAARVPSRQERRRD